MKCDELVKLAKEEVLTEIDKRNKDILKQLLKMAEESLVYGNDIVAEIRKFETGNLKMNELLNNFEKLEKPRRFIITRIEQQ